MLRLFLTAIVVASVSACGGGAADTEQQPQQMDMKTFVMSEIEKTADDTEAVDLSKMSIDMSNEDENAFDEAMR